MSGDNPWSEYLSDVGLTLEVVTDIIFDTATYRRGITGRLTFFDKVNENPSRGNMVLPAQLPNPCSFLVREISLVGLPPAYADGILKLTIGNKFFARYPLRWFVVNARGSVLLHEMVMIAPMVNFRAEIDFAHIPKTQGTDIDIIVSLTGAMARPVA